MIPFYQRIPRRIFKICFSKSCLPSWATRHILEVLLTRRHTLVAQNHWASVRLHHWLRSNMHLHMHLGKLRSPVNSISQVMLVHRNLMYHEWFLHMSKRIQKVFLFLLRFKWCRQKWICILIYLFTASLYIKIHVPRTHISTKKWWTQISNPLSVLNCCLYCARLFITIVTSPS